MRLTGISKTKVERDSPRSARRRIHDQEETAYGTSLDGIPVRAAPAADNFVLSLNGVPRNTRPAADSFVLGLDSRATQQLLVQTKPRVGVRSDRYEREADNIAGEVMRSLSGDSAGVGVGPTEQTPAPRVQRMCADCAEGERLCDECIEERGIPDVQRQERGGEPAAAPTSLLVSDDGPAPESGQMRKAPFLAKLRAAVCAVLDEELTRAGRSTKGCPYLDYWFERLDRHDASYIEGLLRRYAPESRTARSADEYVNPVAVRVRGSVAMWIETGRIVGVPEDLPTLTSTTTTSTEAIPEGGGPVQLKARPGTAGATNPAAIRAHLGAGHALDGQTRARMEGAFGTDFSGVRIHTDAYANQLSTGLHARAFTVGKHMAFDAGEYQPGTLVGDALIAHELAHVLQQSGTTSTSAGEPATRATIDNTQNPETVDHDVFEGDADRSALGAIASFWRGTRGMIGWLAHDAMPRLRSRPRLQRCSDERPKYCPRGKVWAPMPSPAGVGPVCVCRWHCVPEPEKPSLDVYGREVSSFRCAGDCPRPRYAGEDEVVEGPEGLKKHSGAAPSPTSTGIGAHFTPISGENACGCIPPGDIAGAGAADAPLLQPGFEATDIFPHAGADIGRGRTTDVPVERPRAVIEGPAVAGQRGRARAAPVETTRPVETATPIETARPSGVLPPKTPPGKPPTSEVPPAKTSPVGPGAPIGGGPAPAPLEQDPGARLVWGTRKSKIYHEEGSAHYTQMQNEKFPDEKGRRMTAKEAEAAGYRPAKSSPGLEAARRGVAEHAMVKEAMRPFEGRTLANGWQILLVERRVGGKMRVDELWLDDGVKTGSGMKRIFVFDTFTGKVEPPEHYQKGWDYSKEPLIKQYIDQGYMYDYSVAIKHPEMLH